VDDLEERLVAARVRALEHLGEVARGLVGVDAEEEGGSADAAIIRVASGGDNPLHDPLTRTTP
jgi:hypothetical protein